MQAHSGSVYSIKADAFAFGGLALSTTDRSLTRDAAQVVFFFNPRGPSQTSVRSSQSVDVILAQTLPLGGGSASLVKLCTLSSNFTASSADPAGAGGGGAAVVDVGITNNYLTNQPNAPGAGGPGTSGAVGVCSVRRPPDANGWFRVTLWVNPFAGLGWDVLQFRDATGTGATFYRAPLPPL